MTMAQAMPWWGYVLIVSVTAIVLPTWAAVAKLIQRSRDRDILCESRKESLVTLFSKVDDLPAIKTLAEERAAQMQDIKRKVESLDAKVSDLRTNTALIRQMLEANGFDRKENET